MSDEAVTSARDAWLASRVGQPLHQHGEEEDEDRANRRINGILNGWQTAMAGREGIMPRPDGSELRGDDLRTPILERAARSVPTRSDPPLAHVCVSDRADHAIGMFHNLMMALDAMMISEDRTSMRVHLSAEFVMIRALIEAASTAVWILGPDDSDMRVSRTLRIRKDEVEFSARLARSFARYSGDPSSPDFLSQDSYVSGQILDLQEIARRAGLTASDISAPATPGLIAAESGEHVATLGPAVAFWYWSTASSLAHGEPANTIQLADVTFVGLDSRGEPVGQADPSLVSVAAHLDVAMTLIHTAHRLWNERARPS